MDHAAIARDGHWLANRYDAQQDAVHLVRVTREVHREAIFLTDNYLPPNLPTIVLKRQTLFDATPPPAPAHFIFHSAFCCSTLLARGFDVPGVAMGLKEPQIYNDIIGWRHRLGGPPALVAQVLDQATTLLARPLADGETAIIKPSNLVNGLARALLAMRKDSNAILLYAPLDTYLKSVAKKGIDGRLWVRDLLVKFLRDGLIDLGFDAEDYLALTDLQVAAVGWLAQQALFSKLLAEFGPTRVRSLNSETLLAKPEATMRELASHFRLKLDEPAIATIISGPAFNQHSKSATRFDKQMRDDEYETVALLHGEEIEKVRAWAEMVASIARIEATLAQELLL